MMLANRPHAERAVLEQLRDSPAWCVYPSDQLALRWTGILASPVNTSGEIAMQGGGVGGQAAAPLRWPTQAT